MLLSLISGFGAKINDNIYSFINFKQIWELFE